MRAFDQLSEQGQIRRLRKLAVSALPRWPIRVRRLRPLTFWENATWRVQAEQGDFLLRVHRQGYRDRPAIEAELRWLDRLRQAGLPVQSALAVRSGERVVEARGPGGERRHLSLLSWIDGRRRLRPGRRQAAEIGALLARMHLAVEGMEPLPRMAWDEAGWFAPLPTGCEEVDGALSSADRELLARARQELIDRTSRLGRGAAVYGAIHSDLHLHNLVWRGPEPCPIDFDDGGPGWFAMDLGVPSVRLARQDPALVEVMVRAYRELRPLSEEELQLAAAMPALRAAIIPGWLATRQASAAVRRATLPSLRRWMGTLREYYGQAS